MANLLSTSVSGSLSSTGRISTSYNTDRYQFNLARTSGSNWWFTNDSDKLGLHINNVGDRFYFGTGGDFWSSANGWLSTALAGKLSLSGGTMSGDIIFPNDSSAGLRNAAANAGFRLDDQWGNMYSYNFGGGYYVDATSYYFRSSSSANWMTISGGVVTATSDFRAPIFYDSQDTSFYLNPNGYSNLSQVNTNELFIDDQKVLNAVAGNGATGTINAVWGLLKPNGRKLYPDEEFADGYNSVNIYNNNGGSAISIVRKNSGFADASAANMPNKTGYVLEITHAPTTSSGTSPGYGGWYFATWTAPSSSRLLCIFKMKVPAGRYLNWASNSIGSGGSGEWLTSNAGTGQYQDYAYLVHSGTSSFSSTHFFYITGGSSDTFYTYLASATVYDVTNVSEDYVFRQTASADMRAPIFYDSNDTGYYLDPNSGSVLNQVTTTGRIYSNEWIQFSNYTGLYSPNNNAHFRPNSGSYGAWLVTGSRNGWRGIEFESGNNGNVTVMIANSSSSSGFHNNSYGWQIEWAGGTLYVGKGAYGGSTATVLDSSNASYAWNMNQNVGTISSVRFNSLGVNVSPSGTAGRIDASNDIVAYSSSDERLKQNITPIENALDKVKSLTGVEFDWKPEYKQAHGYEGHDTGIIAQQVQEVMPSAVRTNDTGFLAVRYEKLIGLLIEANKELAARVEELEKKLG